MHIFFPVDMCAFLKMFCNSYKIFESFCIFSIICRIFSCWITDVMKSSKFSNLLGNHKVSTFEQYINSFLKLNSLSKLELCFHRYQCSSNNILNYALFNTICVHFFLSDIHREQKEDHDIESIMLRKGLLTAMKP